MSESVSSPVQAPVPTPAAPAQRSPFELYQVAAAIAANPDAAQREAALRELAPDVISDIFRLARDAFPIALAGATWIVRETTRGQDEMGFQVAVAELRAAIYPILNEESRAILRRRMA